MQDFDDDFEASSNYENNQRPQRYPRRQNGNRRGSFSRQNQGGNRRNFRRNFRSGNFRRPRPNANVEQDNLDPQSDFRAAENLEASQNPESFAQADAQSQSDLPVSQRTCDLGENAQNTQNLAAEQNLEIIKVEGIFEPTQNDNGVLLDPKRGGKSRPSDTYVSRDLARRFSLKRGQYIVGTAHRAQNHQNPKLRFIETIDGVNCLERRKIAPFQNLTTISAEEKLRLETKDHRMTNRVIDIFCPIGKGTRGLIVAPPRTGKTTLLKDIAFGILENHPECHLIILLVDERPEEVTDFRMDLPSVEIFASSNDERLQNHIAVADLAIERAKHLVEVGKDVVILMDSLTRLARAHNSAKGGGGRTMSGGLDIRALERPRQIFSAARNTEEAGSLTIIASALIETGSKMDELIFQEFKGTGNMEMVLNRKIAELRIWPAINLGASGTRKEELLLSAKELEASSFLRRAMANAKPEDTTETLIERMSQTKTNAEFIAMIL